MLLLVRELLVFPEAQGGGVEEAEDLAGLRKSDRSGIEDVVLEDLGGEELDV